MFLEYVRTFHLQDCLNILSDEDILGYYNINIDFLKLFETYPDVGDKVLCNPVKVLPSCNKDILKLQQKILEEEEFSSHRCKLQYKYLKRNVHARFFGLPVCPELHRTIFPKNIDLGCFLKVTGTVVRVTQSKMLEYQRKYVCMKCKFENSVEADFENRYILKAPTKCENTESRCKCSTFTQVNLVSREHCRDYQEIKIQEQVNKLSIGTIPGSMWVVLEDDLVDCCKPGDDVIICGTVRRRWRPPIQNKKSEVEIVLQANYIDVSNSQKSEVIAMAPDVKDCFDEFWLKYEQCPLKGRDQIVSSVCPQVYGLYLVKLAVLLTVITGSNHLTENKNNADDKHTSNVRGQCHLLLVGDPGTGKSQLLKASAELTPRSVFTSGSGSTRAGLTCAALREEGEWQLEAGALVLADGGVCCIDELTHLRDHDRAAIHEAMEQQTISVAKAGMVCKLCSRCAVLGACNPPTDRRHGTLADNLTLGTPLISRFDLIFILLDTKNKAWDDLVSSYILFGDADVTSAKKKWTSEKIQMYISLIGPRPTKMTKSANTILQCYYMMQRKSEYRDPSRTSVRMLDSLIRLSQAHCRLMYRTTILPLDAIVAISLVDLSMQDNTLDDSVDALHSTFQKYPDFEYLCTAKQLLTRLNLCEIWTDELLYYGKLLEIDHKTLEHHIDNKCDNLFARYDDVTDNNIPLSISLVTSSYFKKNQDETDKIKKDIAKDTNNKDKAMNDKLAATLKKHATLNIIEKKSPEVQKKKLVRRKRKEVTVDISNFIKENSKKRRVKVDNNILNSDDDGNNYSKETDILNITESTLNPSSIEDVPIKNIGKVLQNNNLSVNKKNKHNKDTDTSKKVSVISNTLSEIKKRKVNPRRVTIDGSKIVKNQKGNKTKVNVSDNVKYEKNLLNKVPSVNDVYSTIGIDFNLESDSDDVNEENEIDNPQNLEKAGKSEFNPETRLKCKTPADTHVVEEIRNNALNKLKKFEFQEKSDLNKFYKESVPTSGTVGTKQNNLSKPTRSSSQISMFESSDCEIDIDI